MKLSSIQQAILLHRFDCPDAMVDSILDSFLFLPATPPSQEQVERAVANLRRLIDHGFIDLPSLDWVEVAVLEDAMRSSAWFANLESAFNDGKVSLKQILADSRAADELEQWWEATYRVTISIPRI